MAFVVGVGLTKFTKPKTSKVKYPELAEEAARKALKDANLTYSNIDAVVVSHVYGESTSGQKAVYKLGLRGIPIFNTNNNCSSASCAIMLSQLMVKSGQFACVLALGFEQMENGLTTKWDDREHPAQSHFDCLHEHGVSENPLPGLNYFTSEVLKIYAHGAREHMKLYGTTQEQFAKIAYKNHMQSVYNPNACMGKETTVEKCLERTICPPVTLAMCSLTADGAAAAVICSAAFAKANNLMPRAVKIVAQKMKTDLPSTFETSIRNIGGYELARQAANECYKESGLSPKDIDVIELHDCFACNELFMYEALGLCQEGAGGRLVDDAVWITNRNGGKLFQLGGRWVVNPDGGLEGKGHPIGATGLAQCAELVSQLRGEAGIRQVDGARVGLQHNYGIGSAAVVTLYEKVPSGVVPASKL